MVGGGMERIINGKKISTDGFHHLYPFESRSITVDGGHSLHYLDEGRGRPVVMVHGNPTWSFYFRHLALNLSKDYRVIVPDHIGCGFSDKPAPDSYGYRLEDRVRDLDTLIKSLELQEKITLVIHDWGGMIAIAWALNNPDQVEKLVITNTSGFLLPREKRFPLRLGLIKYLTPFGVPGVLGLNLFSRAALYMAPALPLSREVKTGLTAPYNSWKNRIATLRFVQNIPLKESDESFKLVKWVDDNLNNLNKISLMILWGAKDFVFDKKFLKEWQRRFPNAPCHLFSDAGHYLFEDKPKECLTLIRKFLNS